jgi:predicted RNase H-like HicB family nuclease
MKQYLVLFEKTKTGYSAYVPDLQGCIATGRTKEEVKRHIHEAIEFHLEGLVLEGIPIPNAITEGELMSV